ncbi:condensation domain-containing protein [Micromonospora sp. SH-82]|uniref:condensation domain-containing protein n=1 Tax=Micromonospora sp. SH-82 TaxID=3132938 RepID=UPI003EBF686C
MQQIPISDLDIGPGWIHEWCLVAPDTLDLAAVANKSASYNQEKHFSAALDARREHVAEDHWVAMTFRVDGQVDLAALEAALHRFVARHEVLRCGFEQLAGDLRCDVMPPSDVVLQHTEVGYRDSTEAVRDHLESTFDQTISALNWPLFRMGVVVEPQWSTVYLAFDHIVCDGMSLAVAVEEIQRWYAEAAAGAVTEFEVAGSYLDFGAAQRRRYAGMTADGPELAYWRSFLARCGDFFPEIPLDLGIESGRMYPAENRMVQLLDDAAATAFEQLCRRHDGKLFMGVLAVAGLALGRLSGADTYHGLMPVGERQDPRYRSSFGWFVNTMPISFPISADRTFPETVAAVGHAFRELIESVEVPFVKAWELLAPEYYHMRMWPYPVNFFSFLDFRRAPGAEHYDTWRPRTIPQASHTNTGNMWFYRNADGLHLHWITADAPTCVQAMAAYRRAVSEILAELLDG